ncbi:hypothetical protein BDZ91DRAFT_760227 [Kalaharituber pfeilii]|nr:hypothetical protein BDZ91DRAFT_760227 [Kalaharituber pfeilii]
MPGPLGCLAAWLLGCLAAWLLGCLAAWLLGCLAAWLLGAVRIFNATVRPSVVGLPVCSGARERSTSACYSSDEGVAWLAEERWTLDGRHSYMSFSGTCLRHALRTGTVQWRWHTEQSSNLKEGREGREGREGGSLQRHKQHGAHGRTQHDHARAAAVQTPLARAGGSRVSKSDLLASIAPGQRARQYVEPPMLGAEPMRSLNLLDLLSPLFRPAVLSQ